MCKVVVFWEGRGRMGLGWGVYWEGAKERVGIVCWMD